MKVCSLFLAALFPALFLGCELLTVDRAPMTADVIRAGATLHINEPTLRDGRRLFVSRCIECHTLPIAWYYTQSEWPRIVHRMAERAALKPAEEKAIVAYIRALRAQP